ncbi:hypothetical protein MIND_01231200 [Mycena indigotica]|uniref:DUF6533 domain-containing protein n=1 Tax=Mycena indigotica TaxID=2126181 RepID=A0A8H6VU58_9AGAR|nr:uncharacterized protein MIND_01231200 [Mycena indigotica]KAF7292051.1 hypothetical protein MIND_01231200 [Mycena indigotica]
MGGDSSSVFWAERVLISAAVLYLYDCVLTLHAEWHFYALFKRSQFSIHALVSFVVLRYIPICYHVCVVLRVVTRNWNAKR